ncbi:MAG: ThiF family adenylyltransferase, partial [Anaerolineae bacterium]
MAGLPYAAPVVTHLAACGVGRWLWADPGDDSAATLQTYLQAQHGPALALHTTVLPPREWSAAVRHDPPDLLIVVGSTANIQPVQEVIKATQAPTLLISLPSATHPCQATSLFPPFFPLPSLSLSSLPISPWNWLTAAPLCAGLARAMLLRDTPYRRVDLEALWGNDLCALTLGEGDDPFSVCWSATADTRANPSKTQFRTPVARRGNLLIAGLGSLGSVAAMHLAPHAARMVIADPDRVDVYNPVRQAYSLAAVGRPKAQALRDGLLAAGVADVVALETALTDEQELADLIVRHGIAAALVVTGTAADFAIARALRACDVP